MFDTYLADSDHFLELARSSESLVDKRRYYRSCVFVLSSSVESFVNLCATTISHVDLPEHFILFINDKQVKFTNNKFKQVNKYNSVEDKLKILLAHFKSDFDFNCNEWVSYKKLKSLRDSLIHSREEEDILPITQYDLLITQGLSSIIKIINTLCLKIFNQPIRKGLLQLAETNK